MYTINRKSIFYRWLSAVDCEMYLDNTCDLPKVVASALGHTFIYALIACIFFLLAACMFSAVTVLPLAYLKEGLFSFKAIESSVILAAGVVMWVLATVTSVLVGVIKGVRWARRSKDGREPERKFRDKLRTGEIVINGLDWMDFAAMTSREQEYIMAEHGMFGQFKTWWIMQKHKVCHQIEIVD